MTTAAQESLTRSLADFHAAFADGDASRLAECFADDGRLFLLHRELLDGPDAIREHFRSYFARVDTSAWEPRTELVERHDAHAYVFSTYAERALSREDGTRTLVRGRLVHFLRRGEDGAWRITLLMNSHSHPMEPIP
jgi:uncharacterized protein (TIGR02246 family)